MKKYIWSVAVILLLLCPFAALADTLKVTFLDVGRGDAILLECGGHSMLLDTGSNETEGALLAALDSTGIIGFDYLVGTHPHEDHIGGIDAVFSKYDVYSVWMPRVLHETQAFEEALQAVQASGLLINAPTPGTQYELGDAVITILAPMSSAYENIDDYSIVFRVDHGRNSFLFTGDIDKVGEDELLASKADIHANVLKVSNHGGGEASSKAFLDLVKPEIAVISCGANDAEFPKLSTLQALEAAGAAVLRTDENGIIEITSDGTTLFYNEEIAVSPEEEWLGYTNTRNVNVRKGAGKREDRIAYLAEGVMVRVLLTVENDPDDVWYLVEHEDVRGYVLSDFIDPVNAAEELQEEIDPLDEEKLNQYFMPEGGMPSQAPKEETPIAEPQQETQPAGSQPTMPTGAGAAPTIPPMPSSGAGNTGASEPAQYIGNVISKIFHLSSCDSLPSAKNRVTFESRANAVDKGYIPCLNCTP